MPPKRKAEVLLDDSNANTTRQRTTRSTGPAPPTGTAATTSKRRATRLLTESSTLSANKPTPRTYGRKRNAKLAEPVITVSDSDGESEVEDEEPVRGKGKEVVKAKPAGRPIRGRGRTIAQADAASTSSKENAPKPTKATRGRAKPKPAEEEEKTVPDSENEALEELVKPRQAAKRRKTAANSSAEEVQKGPAPAKRTAKAKAAPAAAVKAKAKTHPPAPAPRATRSRKPAPEIAEPQAAPARTRGRAAKPKEPSPDVPTPEQSEEEPEREHSPSPPKSRRNTLTSTTTTRTTKRPRSPTPEIPDLLPRKRQAPSEEVSEPAKSLFTDDEDEHASDDLPAQPLPQIPPSSSKKRVVVDMPVTPKRVRGANKAPPAPESSDEESDDEIPIPPSPSKQPVTPSRRQRIGIMSVPSSPTKATGSGPLLPPHLVPCLNAQKRAVLRALNNPPALVAAPAAAVPEPAVKVKGKGKAREVQTEVSEDYDNTAAYEQLKDLLEGTVARNEGNSCLLLGPRGSGKTRLSERCISELSQSDSKTKPILIRLSGWAQSNDRLALRQIAIQLAEQTGGSYLSQFEDAEDSGGDAAARGPSHDDDNPFLDDGDAAGGSNEPGTGIALPPSSHLPALISMLPTLNRPTIVLVDAFDLFALHPRQALLYCLLDTAQACQSSQGNKGLAIVGLTSRVDVVNLFEKRVKSRFSGRILRVANVAREEGWTGIIQRCLSPPTTLVPTDDGEEEVTEDDITEWSALWSAGVQNFMDEQTTKQVIHETYSIVRDVRTLVRLLTPVVARLSPAQPYPTSSMLAVAAEAQRSRSAFASLHAYSYPALCLLIASYQSSMKGHPVFNFEMLYDAFMAQYRASHAARVLLHGASIGMMKCSRSLLLSAFESLIAARVFVPTAAHSITTPKEFVKYRSAVEREELKSGITKNGDVGLKKWWNLKT